MTVQRGVLGEQTSPAIRGVQGDDGSIQVTTEEVIDAEFDETPEPITDETVTEAAQEAASGIGPLLLVGAIGFGLYMAFRR